MITFRNVSKVYESKEQKVEALKNIDLTIHKGDIFGVIGFSGAGKSTLIRTVNLLETPTNGEVIVDGKNLSQLPKKELRKEQKKIGMIFQHFHLLNSKTVYENIALPLILSNYPKNKINDKVKETLAFVGLSDKIDTYPDQLSGGQKQRVGIARALVTNPEILLCDEATSALDPQTTASILSLLKKINKTYNITILLITHEMEVIKEICNRVAIMDRGTVVESGKVFDIFTNPQIDTTKEFVKTIVRDDVPQSIYRLVDANGYVGRVFNFKFLGSSSGKPIISQLTKKFNVEVNVLFGNIIEVQEIPFGNLILEIVGSKQELDKALRFAKEQKVDIKEVVSNGNRNRYHHERSVGNLVHG